MLEKGEMRATIVERLPFLYYSLQLILILLLSQMRVTFQCCGVETAFFFVVRTTLLLVNVASDSKSNLRVIP